MPHDTQTDLRLLEDLRNGRDSALNEIIDRWERPLTSFAWRYVQNQTDAEDLVQATFVKVYKYKDRFRPETRLSAWLFTTLANQCRNFGRWQRRHPTVALLNNEETARGENSGTSIDIPDLDPTPEKVAETNDRIALLRKAILCLPHDLKTTLLLYQYEGLSYKEIAEILDCSPKGVETRLYRTRKKLRRILTPQLRESVPLPTAPDKATR